MRETERGDVASLGGLLSGRVVRDLLVAFTDATELPITVRDTRGRFIGSATGTPRWCALLRRSRFGFDGCQREALASSPSIPGEVVDYVCHEVVHHLTAGVFFDGRLLAQMIAGPFVEEPVPDDLAVLEAERHSVPVDDLVISRRELKWLPRRRAQVASRVLKSVASTISRLAELTSERERLLAELTEARQAGVGDADVEGLDGEGPVAQSEGQIVVHLARRSATVDGRVVKLTPKECRILASLARRPGRPVPVDLLLGEAWPEGDGDPTQLWVHVRNLRRKLEPDPSSPRRILTRRGAGYLLASGSATAE